MPNYGSNEYFFAASSGGNVPSEAIANERDRIARKVGGPLCGYVRVNLPGNGWQAWGYCPNRGEPFNRETAREIEAAWDAAGVGLD